MVNQKFRKFLIGGIGDEVGDAGKTIYCEKDTNIISMMPSIVVIFIGKIVDLAQNI